MTRRGAADTGTSQLLDLAYTLFLGFDWTHTGSAVFIGGVLRWMPPRVWRTSSGEELGGRPFRRGSSKLGATRTARRAL
jgi:hypothetical protein